MGFGAAAEAGVSTQNRRGGDRMRIESTSPEMTRRIAAALARLVAAGDLIALTGPLGAGKTCFAQGLAAGLGIRGIVASPSFVIAKLYPGSPGLLHVDAYRLTSAQEFIELGLEEELSSSITVIEWAENVREALPEERIDLRIATAGEDERRLEMVGCGTRQEGIVAELERWSVADECAGD